MTRTPRILQRTFATLLVGAVVLGSTGCLNRPPKQSGVFVSDNAGTAWNATPDLQAKDAKTPKEYPELSVTSVAVSPQDPRFVLAGTDEDLYRSTDGGGTWEKLTEKLPTATKAISVQTIRFHPTQPGTFFVGGVSGGYGKILKSTDRGDSLRDVFTVSQPAQTVTALLPDAANLVFAGDQLGGFYRSTDGGTTWRRTYSASQAITALSFGGNSLFMGSSGEGILKSNDAGTTFTSVNNNLSGEQATVWALAQGFGGLYAGTERGIVVSRDGGGSWQPVGNPLPPDGERVQAITIGSQYIYFAANAVVYRMNPNGDSFLPVQLKLARSVFSLAGGANPEQRLYAGANNTATSFTERFGLGLPGFKLNPGNNQPGRPN